MIDEPLALLAEAFGHEFEGVLAGIDGDAVADLQSVVFIPVRVSLREAEMAASALESEADARAGW